MTKEQIVLAIIEQQRILYEINVKYIHMGVTLDILDDTMENLDKIVYGILGREPHSYLENLEVFWRNDGTYTEEQLLDYLFDKGDN